MKIPSFFYFLLLSIIVVFSSCVSSKEITYFQTEENQIDPEITEMINNYVPRIQSGDILSILVSSLSPEANEMFNPYKENSNAYSTQNTQYSLPPVIGFLVDNSGNVNLPLVGELQVKDLTTEEASTLITAELQKYLVSPSVNIRIANYKVFAMGEFARPGAYTIPNEIVTLPQLISMAGDLTIYGKRENILVIREENGKRTFARIDIRDRNIFNSDYYYLHPNDIIYVEAKKSKATSTDLLFQLSSVTLSGLTFILTVARFFKD